MVVAIRSCLGVDIGSHSIRVAQIEMGKAGPRVVALLEEAIKLDATAQALTETQRHQLIARQLQDMLKRARIGTKNAVFCIPGQSVFVKRPPKLPKTTEERLDRIIRFEARQQIPFPLDKTIMEYQVFEEGPATEVNVLLAAIKREYILNFMKMVKRTGLRPLAISVSSLALYNFHELNTATRDLLIDPVKEKKKKDAEAAKAKAAEKNKPKGKEAAKEKKGGLFGLGKKKTEAKPAKAEAVAEDEAEAPVEDLGFEEVRAYVNLGAALMDLAIPKPGAARMIGFTRSVPLAGNEMDRAVMAKLGLESLEQARKIKETQAAVLSTEFEIEGDAEAVNMEASEAVTAIADRIISELRRSLDYYISQPDGVAVDAIVLSGGLARLPYFRSYIEEKMGLPVELAEVRHQQVRLPDAAPDPFCPFVVAMGLALQGLGLAQNTINFLPEEAKTMQAMRQKPFELVGMAAMLLAIIGMSVGIGENYKRQFDNEVAQYNQNIQQLTKTNADITNAKKRNTQVGDAYDKLSKAASARDYWFFYLQYVVLEQRPPDVLIDELQLRLDGNMIIRGKSLHSASITQFLGNVAKFKPWVFNNLAKFNEAPVTPLPDARFNNQPVYNFTLTARIPLRRARLRTVGENPATTPLQMQQRMAQIFPPNMFNNNMGGGMMGGGMMGGGGMLR